MPFFTGGNGTSSFEVILAGPSRHSTTGTLSSGTSGSRRISLILLHERIWRRIRLCHFCTLIDIVTESAIVSFRTLPVGLPLPTISQSPLSTLFCPWILEHGVSFIISVSGAKILISKILLDTSFYHCLQSVIIRSYFLLMNLRSYNSISVLSFSDSRILNLYNPSKMYKVGFSSLIIEFRPTLNRIPEYRHFEDQWRIGRHNSRQNRWLQ